MKKQTAQKLAAIALAVGVLAFGSANAASTWTFNGSTNYATSNGGDAGGPSLGINGVYAANGASNSGFAAASTWSGGTMTYYSGGGLGMCSDGCGTPNHAIDNVSPNTEAVVLKFGSSVALTSIGLGYVSTDADISLFRYSGAGTPAGTPTLVGTGTSLALMNAAGWSLVGNYANLGTDTSNPYNLVNGANAAGNATASSQSSSWWLISAYNSAYGTGANLGQGNDSFKIFAVAGNKTNTQVPEPGSLALIGIGLLGVFGARRRKQQAVAV